MIGVNLKGFVGKSNDFVCRRWFTALVAPRDDLKLEATIIYLRLPFQGERRDSLT
jgi:hypothetical protein